MKKLFFVFFLQIFFSSICHAELTPLKDYLKNKPTSEWLFNKAEVSYISIRCGSVVGIYLILLNERLDEKLNDKLMNTSLAYIKIGALMSEINGMNRKEFSDRLAKTTEFYTNNYRQSYVADDLKICMTNSGEYINHHKQVFDEVMELQNKELNKH